MRFGLVLSLPLKQALVDTYGPCLAANMNEKPDIWAARDSALEPDRPYAQVVIAVWNISPEGRSSATRGASRRSRQWHRPPCAQCRGPDHHFVR